MIELAVFDLAGTTVLDDDDAVNVGFRAALAAHGLEVSPSDVDEVMGYAKPEAIRTLWERLRGVSPTAAEVGRVHDRFVELLRRHYQRSPGVCEVPGALATFRTLREAGVKVALNTGFSRAIAGALLERLGWFEGQAVDATITSDEAPRGRPHPDMIHALMRRLGVSDAARVAKLGDTPVDILEGRNAGCGLVIAVTTGAFDAARLGALGPTQVLDSVAGAPALLLKGRDRPQLAAR